MHVLNASCQKCICLPQHDTVWCRFDAHVRIVANCPCQESVTHGLREISVGYESILSILGSITLHIIDNARFVSFAPKIILGRRTWQDSHYTKSCFRHGSIFDCLCTGFDSLSSYFWWTFDIFSQVTTFTPTCNLLRFRGCLVLRMKVYPITNHECGVFALDNAIIRCLAEASEPSNPTPY